MFIKAKNIIVNQEKVVSGIGVEQDDGLKKKIQKLHWHGDYFPEIYCSVVIMDDDNWMLENCWESIINVLTTDKYVR